MTTQGIVHAMTSGEFESTIESHDIVFIDFWAKWCAPCRQFASVYEAVAAKHSSIFFAKIDIETEEEIASAFQIRSIPHLMVFKKGIAIYSEPGSMQQSALDDLVTQALAADVSQV
jgi:thioredoxin 1